MSDALTDRWLTVSNAMRTARAADGNLASWPNLISYQFAAWFLIILVNTFNLNKMGIITWIIIGLIAGAIAKAIHPGKDPSGFIVTILIGIAGAVVGGWISSLLGYGTVDGFNIGSLFVAILGAVILLFIYRKVTTKS